MVRALIDTNVLIDFLSGHEQARLELEHHARPAISIITWMEVLVGAEPHEESMIRRWLDSFERIGVDDRVAGRVVIIRRERRIRLPDAIIWASAQVHGMLLVSRNHRDFPEDAPDVRVPY